MNHHQHENDYKRTCQSCDNRIPSEKKKSKGIENAACMKESTHPKDSTPMKQAADIKLLFASTDSLFPIDEALKENSLQILRREVANKEVHLLTSKRKIWQNQMRYADRNMLWFHITGCILMLLLIKMMYVHDVDISYMITASMLLTGVLGAFSVIQTGRVCFAKIAELSETCLFNVRQMTAFDMILSGIINLTALFAGILFAGYRWKIQLLHIGLYLLVPFVLTQCVCLGILLTETGRRNPWMLLAAGIFLSVFLSILASTPLLYKESMLIFWGITLLAGTALLGIQIKMLFTAIGKGEILCTN